MNTTTDLNTYAVPDPQNGVGLLNLGPAGKTFLACRGIVGGLLPDEAPVVVDRAAMLLWAALAEPQDVADAVAQGDFGWPEDEAPAPQESETDRQFRVQTCGRYVLESAYSSPERGYCVFDRATWDGWYTPTRRAAVSAVFYLNEAVEEGAGR